MTLAVSLRFTHEPKVSNAAAVRGRSSLESIGWRCKFSWRGRSASHLLPALGVQDRLSLTDWVLCAARLDSSIHVRLPEDLNRLVRSEMGAKRPCGSLI